MTIQAVFLDRDGVINFPIIKEGKPYPPQNWEEFKIIPGVEEGIKLLKKNGFLTIVVTNQPDVGRGTIKKEVVEAIHQNLKKNLEIDEIRVCYDDGILIDSENRKPKPGMLLAAAKQNKIDLTESYMIGDRWRDIDAGVNAGCRTIFIDYGYDEKLNHKPDYKASSLLEAAQLILQLRSQQ